MTERTSEPNESNTRSTATKPSEVASACSSSTLLSDSVVATAAPERTLLRPAAGATTNRRSSDHGLPPATELAHSERENRYAAADQEPARATPTNAPVADHPLAEIKPLTALRGVLAWWVVLFHLGPDLLLLFPSIVPAAGLLRSGDFAVDVFFMLSGFVMWHVHGTHREQVTLQTYRKFLVARLARLYPVHIVQQLAWLLLIFAALRAGVSNELTQTYATGLVQNVLLVHAWAVPLKTYANYPAWSISMEWLAYVSTPLVFALIGHSRLRFNMMIAAPLVWLTSVALYDSPAQHYVRITCGYVLGAILSRAYSSGALPRRLGNAWWLLAALLVGSAVLCHATGLGYVWLAPVSALFIAALGHKVWPSPGKHLSALLYLGRSSYSVYMTHALSIVVLHKVMDPAKFATASFAIRTAMTLAYLALIALVGTGTYHWVEEPARKRIRRLASDI